MNRISGVIVSVFTVSVVDRVFEPNWVKANYYKIDIFCVSTVHTSLKVTAKTGSRIMCTRGAICLCLSSDVCLSGLALFHPN
jgi:hypothetical protein